MASFVKQGYQLSVHTYEAEREYPDGIEICDAAEILPPDLSTAYTQAGEKGSLASFSNRFRYKLLFERGGIWVDSDMLCLNPAAKLERVVKQSPDKIIVALQDGNTINNAVLIAPQGHTLFKSMLREVEEAGFDIKKWGAIGPTLVSKYIAENRHSAKVLSEQTFYPIDYGRFFSLLLPERKAKCEELCKNSYAVHLWNEFYRSNSIPKNVLPPEGSFLHEIFVDLLGDIAPTLPANTLRLLINGSLAIKELSAMKSSHSQ